MIAGFAAAAASLVLFGYLANEVLSGQTIRFDASVRNAIHAWATPRLTYVMRGVTWLGSPVFLVSLAAILLWRLLLQGRRRAAVILIIASLGAEALDQILKLAFRRVRPEAFFNYHAMGYSFPSGHSISSCCFYGVLAAIVTARLRSRAWKAAIWAAAALLSLAIGISRIYLGVHYPSDVLAGYAAAIIWVAALRAGYGIWRRRRPTVTEGPDS